MEKSLRLRLMAAATETKEWTRLTEILESVRFLADSGDEIMDTFNILGGWSSKFEAKYIGGECVALRPVYFDNMVDSIAPPAHDTTYSSFPPSNPFDSITIDLSRHESLVDEIPTTEWKVK